MEGVKFLICGAQKAGTSALDAYLRRHPDLIFPSVKELHYFDRESYNWEEDSEKKYLEYHHMFDQNRKGIRGESTPVYLYWKSCAERIWRYNQHMKLIVILRNPITRAFSHWSMEYSRGRETLDFLEAIKQEKTRFGNEDQAQHRVFSYIDRGLYCQQIKRLWKWFGKEAVLILRQEELKKDPDCVLNMIYKHLKVNETEFTDRIERNNSRYDYAMCSEAQKYLKKSFEQEIEKLERMLGWNCQNWLKE